MKDQEGIDRHERSFTIIKKISKSIEEIERRTILVDSYSRRSRNHFNEPEKAEG